MSGNRKLYSSPLMIRTLRVRGVRAAATLAWLPSAALPCQGQSVSLGFDPKPLTRVVTVSSSEVVLCAEDASPGPARADTVVVKVLEGVTRFIDAADLGAYSVFLQYDSVRARRRSEGARWRSLEASDRQRASVRALLNARMRVTSAEFVELPHLDAARSEMMRGLAGGVHFALPDTAVHVGSSWTGDVGMSLALVAWARGAFDVSFGDELVSRMSATLDSMRVRGIDTLAFLTLRGRFAPQSVDVLPEDDGRTAVARGWLAATLTWSSGWDAYVTGAVRSTVDVELRGGGARRGGLTVRIHVTTQFQVRV